MVTDIVRCLTCETYAERPKTDARTPLAETECATCSAKDLRPVVFEVALLNTLFAILGAIRGLEES
jgi:hypothetical protein